MAGWKCKQNDNGDMFKKRILTKFHRDFHAKSKLYTYDVDRRFDMHYYWKRTNYYAS